MPSTKVFKKMQNSFYGQFFGVYSTNIKGAALRPLSQSAVKWFKFACDAAFT